MTSNGLWSVREGVVDDLAEFRFRSSDRPGTVFREGIDSLNGLSVHYRHLRSGRHSCCPCRKRAELGLAVP